MNTQKSDAELFAELALAVLKVDGGMVKLVDSNDPPAVYIPQDAYWRANSIVRIAAAKIKVEEAKANLLLEQQRLQRLEDNAKEQYGSGAI